MSNHLNFRATAATLLSALLFQLPHLADAHRPLLTRSSCDSDYGSSTSALPIPDPTISWAFQHYADCTNRVLWSSFINPNEDFKFYVGVGVPPVDRYEDVRANALIIGPGLPKLTEEEMASLPEEVRNDPIWENDSDDFGAYYHVAPQDQSTCDHLGTVMFDESTVRNGRCDFYEPFGQTHSWRVLDADENNIPVKDATYHVAVFLQEDVSAKFGVALGTWVENFWNPYDIDTPTCTRVIEDFSEKNGDQSECFPKVSCPALDESEVVGCAVDATEVEVETKVCELGQVCPDFLDPELCIVAGQKYIEPTMGACGGQRCPAAVNMWEMVNMKMHEGMMDLEYTGDAEIDFVRGMIPHHVGAVHMCDALLNLTCTEVEAIDSLEGLVHLCSHINYEQEIEVGGMLKWLELKGLEEKAPCPLAIEMEISSMARMEGGEGSKDDGMMMDQIMPESCGATTVDSSAAFIELNHKMMAFMSVEYSCDHSVDFIRQMIPHHAAAIEMCDIVVDQTEDEYLVKLCNNITLTQKAEISWMYEWLSERDTEVTAPCDAECDSSKFMTRPCEDLLSTGSFCHGLSFGMDGYCRCEETLADGEFSCDSVSYVQGVGVFMPALECKRTCGLCGVDGNGAGGAMSWSGSNGGDASAWSGGNGDDTSTMSWPGQPGKLRKLAAVMDEKDRSIWPHSCYKPMDHSMPVMDHADHSMHDDNHMPADDSHNIHNDEHILGHEGDTELLPSASAGSNTVYISMLPIVIAMAMSLLSLAV